VPELYQVNDTCDSLALLLSLPFRTVTVSAPGSNLRNAPAATKLSLSAFATLIVGALSNELAFVNVP
jgi:hypothetical protein